MEPREAEPKDTKRERRDRRSHSNHAAYFPLYWRDWLSDPRVRAMSRDERGGFIDVLCFTQGETTPGVMTEEQVRRWAGYTTREWPRHRPAFAACFKIRGDVWTQARAKRERVAQKRRFKSAVSAGKKGARKRWGDKVKGRVAMQGAITETYPCPSPTPSPTPKKPTEALGAIATSRDRGGVGNSAPPHRASVAGMVAMHDLVPELLARAGLRQGDGT